MSDDDHVAIAAHRYARGHVVRLFRSLAMPNVAEGAYTVLALLPERDGKFQYRVKSDREPYERVVKEDELAPASMQDSESPHALNMWDPHS